MQPTATQTPPTETREPAPAPASTGPTKPASTKSAYGKRPMWQWVLIYVVAAIIIYGIIYYVWIRKSGTGTTSSGY